MISIILLNGLLVGSVYALLAMALNFSYKSSEIANFAQGELATLSTFFAFALLTQGTNYFWGALLLALTLSFGLGYLLERTLLQRVKGKGHLPPVILTLGVQLFVYGLMGAIWGPEPQVFVWPEATESVLIQASFPLKGRQLLSLGLALVLLLGLGILLRYTVWGLLIKATQQHSFAAKLNGIRVERIRATTFGISAVLGGMAGFLLAPIASLDAAMMWDPMIKAFAAAVLGGMRSLRGAVLGGYLLGLTESLVGYYVDPQLKALLPFLLIVGVLWFRPKGLLQTDVRPKL